MHFKKNSSSEIVNKLNAKNAKIIAVCLVVGFSVYHGIRHIKYGVDSCTLIMKDGRYDGKTEWRPYGCMMHQYNSVDTKRCFKLLQFLGQQNHITFVGDARIYDLFGAFVRAINDKAKFKRVSDQNYVDAHLGLKVEYLHTSYFSHQTNSNIADHFKQWRTDKDYPNFVIVGFGIEDVVASQGSPLKLNEFQYNLTKLIPTIDRVVNKGVKVIWALSESINTLAQPLWDEYINNTLIDTYNNAALEILRLSKVDLFVSHKALSEPFLQDMKDGLRLLSDHKARTSGAQILLNVYCNDHMNFNDGSCCSSIEQYTTLQLVTFAILLFCLILAIIAVGYEKYRKWRKKCILDSDSQSESVRVITALGKLALIMGYFYVCDRTNFFMKETKYYSRTTFWIPVVYVFSIGLFFTEESQYSKVLHKDQTDEWKGWMQIVILIYHWTNSANVLPLYMVIRVLVSAYLFLSGYGHFYYFWQRGDGSIIRLFQVLFRLNFMTFMLCLVMNRPYQFYNYVPVISFWFMMMYLVLILPPHVTAVSSESHPIQYLYLVLKFVGLFGIITTLYMSEVFFEKVFVTRPWKALFVTTDDDIHEWWFRWKVDRYSVAYGMVFSALFLLVQRFNLLDDNNHNNLFSNGVSLSATLASLIGLGSYTAFAFLCRDREECNEIHSYSAFIPILSYIVLRNVSGVLRTRYSTFFAWFGRISLELFVGQYHIWLAGDSHGVLVLAPKYTNLNAFITSFIFVCASHEIHDVTNTLLPYAVPSEWYAVMRNVLLFVALLVPIGVHDGMF